MASPHPAARTSLAANNRRPCSSRFEPSASHRCRIARASIMPTLVMGRRAYRDRPQLSHTVAPHPPANPIHLSLRLSLDADFVSRYLPHVHPSVSIRLLARKHFETLIPAAKLFAQQSKARIELRSA